MGVYNEISLYKLFKKATFLLWAYQLLLNMSLTQLPRQLFQAKQIEEQLAIPHMDFSATGDLFIPENTMNRAICVTSEYWSGDTH